MPMRPTGGTATVDATPVCLGDPIIWRIDQDAQDNGGIKRVFCTAKQAIDPVTPSYTWVITKPDGTRVSGSGRVATPRTFVARALSPGRGISVWRRVVRSVRIRRAVVRMSV